MIKNAIGSIKKNKSYYIPMLLLCVGVFAELFVLNRLTGLHDDDYHFKFVFFAFKPVPYDRLVAGIGDIFVSIKNYYLLSGGRALAHFFTYLMLYLGKPIFNLINSLMFISLGLLITFIVRGKAQRKSAATPALMAAVLAALWLTLPAVGETVFWVSGSCNYLWMACLSLAFLLRYVNYYRGDSRLKNNAPCAVTMLIFGILAGATNENSGGAVMFILFIYFLMCKKERIKIPVWAYTGVVGLAGGIAFLVLAPGNANRAAAIEHGRLVSITGSVTKLVYVLNYLKEGAAAVILAAIALLMLMIFIKKDDTDKRILNTVFAYLTGGFLALMVLALTPEYLDRPLFFSGVLLVLGAAKAAAAALDCLREADKKALGRAAIAAVGLAACAALAVSMRGVYGEYKIMDEFNQYEYAFYAAAQERGEKEVTMDVIAYAESTYNVNYFVKNIGDEPTDYINQWLAKYYGFERIYMGDIVYSLDELKPIEQ